MSRAATATIEAGIDEAFLRRAVDQADLNALRVALYQQTRDPDLARMSVVRQTREGSPFETTVVPEAHHQAIKDKAVAFLRGRGRVRPVTPSRAEAARMMEMFAGEPMSPAHLDYGWEDLAFEGFPRAAAWRERPPPEVVGRFNVIIVGAGFSGLLAAIQFDLLGIDYRIIERQAGVGGTWFLNQYPEARVDVTTFLYQFKFEKDYPWKSYYATQAELADYLDHIVDKYDLRRRISLETKVLSAAWDAGSKTWRLQVEGPHGAIESLECNFVVSASGLFSTPQLPDIPGIETFKGEMFHTTAWNRDFDYAGKRVALIGTGSTGSQLARGVAERAASLTIYQRSPKWLSRVWNYRHPVSPETQWLLANMPGYVNWYCFGLHVAALQMDAFHDVDRAWQAAGGIINQKNDLLRANLQTFIRRKIADDALYEQLVPHYAPLARRLVVDNDWYDTLQRDDVTLVSGRIDRFTETGIVTADGERAFDLVVLAAGFDVAKYLWPVDYEGRDGARLEDLWNKDGARAHLTLTVPGFPNFIIMYGPNAGILSGSFHSWIELYTRYFCRLITDTIEAGAASFEVKRPVYEAYNTALDRKMTQKLWLEQPDAGGYYVNAHGRPGASMPWSLEEFYEMIREPNLDEYILA
jgi:4-hydroxyacetophenone monooxygenase